MKTYLSLILTFGLLAGIMLVGTGCNSANGSNSDEAEAAETSAPTRSTRATQVETLVATSTTFDDIIELTGTVEALKDAMVAAEAGGRVEYLAPLGTRVGTGAVVARFDSRLLQSAYNAAKAQYDLAEDTFNRQEALYRDSIISALEFQNIRAQRDQTKALFDQAAKQLADTRLRVPFAGRVEMHQVDEGEFVAPGTPVMRVVNTRKVKVVVGVPERYASDIRKGTTAEVQFRAYGNTVRNSQVSFVGSVIDAGSRTFPVEIELGNASGELKPEMVADVTILRERLENAIVIPQSAVLRDESGPSVFIAKAQGDGRVAARQSVTLGPSFAGKTVITEGLNPTDEVIVVGQANLTEGDVVEVQSSNLEL